MTTENSGTQAATEGTGTEAGTATASPAAATASPAPQAGQAEAGTGPAPGASPEGAAQQQEPSFFDPNSIKDKPELMAAYKQMQKAYTQKTQAIAEQRRKVEAYDGFVNNPDAVVQYLTQLGYNVNRPGQQAARPADGAGNPDTKPFEPQTWEDVFDVAEQRVIAKLEKQLGPVIQNVRETTARNIEQQLSAIDANWKLYEDDMKETLRQHPTLVKDVAKLYRMSVPEEVQRERAVKEALAKHSQKTASAAVHGSGTMTRTAPAPMKVNSFEDAVKVAREQLKAQGGR